MYYVLFKNKNNHTGAMSEKTTKNPARPFGGLTPAEAARRSVEAREEKRRAEQKPQERGSELLRELVQAAFGVGEWKKLRPGERLTALVKANEYINGRPVPMKPSDEDTSEEDSEFSVVPKPGEAPTP